VDLGVTKSTASAIFDEPGYIALPVGPRIVWRVENELRDGEIRDVNVQRWTREFHGSRCTADAGKRTKKWILGVYLPTKKAGRKKMGKERDIAHFIVGWNLS
jgi:hypothetical protein